MRSLYLQLFDIQICLQTNDDALCHFITTVYKRLLIDKATTNYVTYVLQQSGDQALFITPTTQVRLQHWPQNRGEIIDLVLFEMMQSVQSHMLFHGAALVIDGKGIAIVADSQQGKTTLTLALLQAGAHFMSDESAAIRVGTTELNGMPRALSIRPNTTTLLGLADNLGLAVNDNVFCDIDLLFPGQHSERAPLKKLFILSNTLGESPTDLLYLRLHRISAEWRSAVQALPTVQRLKANAFDDCVEVVLQVAERNQTFATIETLSIQHNILILTARTHIDHAPSFARSPSATTLSKSQAAIEMLGHLQGGQRSRLIEQQFSGVPGKLFQALIRSLKDADCIRLQAGHLDETVTLMQELISSS